MAEKQCENLIYRNIFWRSVERIVEIRYCGVVGVDKSEFLGWIRRAMPSDNVNLAHVDPRRKNRVKDGLVPGIALTGGVAVTLVWTMTASDPYWRLVDAESLPAPAYESATDIRSEMLLSNGDTGAVNPASEPLIGASRVGAVLAVNKPVAIADDAIAARHSLMAEPIIAMVAPFEPAIPTGPAIDPTIAYVSPREIIPVSADLGLDAGFPISSVPFPLPAPAAFRDHDMQVGQVLQGEEPLSPIAVPNSPVPPHFAANVDTELALGLDRSGRIDVQRRLALAGFEPSGYDGVFGERTRGAIADFQVAWGFPVTGYLEPAVFADLNQRTEEAYQALQRRAATQPSGAPELAPVARERQIASVQTGGRCIRNTDGRIIERQGLVCDLTGFSESFVSFGRDTLPGEEPSSAGASALPPNLVPGVDR